MSELNILKDKVISGSQNDVPNIVSKLLTDKIDPKEVKSLETIFGTSF